MNRSQGSTLIANNKDKKNLMQFFAGYFVYLYKVAVRPR